MNKIDFPISTDVNMSGNPPSCRRLLGVVMLAAIFVALISGPQQVFAASGYWKYDGYQITPTQEQLAAIKPMPGRVHELRASGGFQAGPGGAKGSLELFFKTDNVDLEVFLATSTLNFGASVQLATLTPGQKVVFDVTIMVGGNDKSRAIPATGSGKIAIDNGEYIAVADAKLGQTASAKGAAVIPNGGPGAIMLIRATSYLAHYGAMSEEMSMRYVWVEGATPPPTPPNPVSRFGSVLGPILNVMESAGGAFYNGIWTRRAGTDIFDAVWNDSIRDVVEIESVKGNQIVLYRHGNKGRYYGMLTADGNGVVNGTASWYSAGWLWTGTVSGR
jgi:hypothetical protein